MFNSQYSRQRASLGGPHGTPSKDHIILDIAGEENHPNSFGVSRRSSTKRGKPDSLSQAIMNIPEERPDKRMCASDRPEFGSDCDTEVSSTVCARREWLKEFEKQQVSNLPKKTGNETFRHTIKSTVPPAVERSPAKARRAAPPTDASSAASALLSRMMTPSHPSQRNFSRAPPKFQGRGNQVEATDDGYASVASLSQWLANDPTSSKKKKHVRRGMNVIKKSRKFDRGLEDVIVLENNIPRGSVKDRQKWLQGAFHEEEEEECDVEIFGQKVSLNHRYAKSEVGYARSEAGSSVADKKAWLKSVFKTGKEESNEEQKEEARSEVIVNDAASSLSVSDKKDWLQKAFKGGKEATPKKIGYNRAMTDVMYNRRGEDTASRAKRRFLERRRTPSKATPMKSSTPSKTGTPISTPSYKSVATPVFASPAMMDSVSKNNKVIRDTRDEERTGPPKSLSAVESSEERSSVVELAPNAEEDQTPVDFRAARQALIQRGKQNGHKMQVVNKVFMKKTKFEKIEKEHRRRSSNVHGLLKPSWEEADTTIGRPSDAYDKKFVSDIAPKKSFEELP